MTMSHQALFLIDFQEDFLSPRGRLPVDPGQIEPVIAAAQGAVDVAQTEGHLIVKIGNQFRAGDLIRNLFRHHASIKGSAGSVWDGRIDPPGAAFVPKWKASAFCNPALGVLLDEARVDTVRITGLYAKACVTATAKAAQRRGLSVQVIGDATACSSDDSRRSALDGLRKFGIEIV
jgi:nicotinamidase-related amidase